MNNKEKKKFKEINKKSSLINKSTKKFKNKDPNNLQNLKEIKPNAISKNKSIIDEIWNNHLIKKNNPKFFENYELIEFINQGSSGGVFKIKHRIHGKILACKISEILKKNKQEKENKEVSIHKKFHHKNIPEIYAYYQLGPQYSCMIMEINRNGDLVDFKRKVVKRPFLSETLTCYICGGIITALSYLNKKNVIHMDIKQQNILIDEYLNIKVTDFSVSLSYEKNQKFIDLPLFGTCYYMSPEVLERKKILPEEASKIDMFSLGVLIYHLAFNDYPYNLSKIDSKNYKGILKNILETNLEFPKKNEYSDMFKNFVKKCLEKDITKRYNIYQAKNDPWMKGYQIILDEKENLYSVEKFLIEMIVDNIKQFKDYINNG